jgi:hypothetical protein
MIGMSSFLFTVDIAILTFSVGHRTIQSYIIDLSNRALRDEIAATAGKGELQRIQDMFLDFCSVPVDNEGFVEEITISQQSSLRQWYRQWYDNQPRNWGQTKSKTVFAKLSRSFSICRVKNIR